jgi:hypothetical protein
MGGEGRGGEEEGGKGKLPVVAVELPPGRLYG